ncbi:hypothetical protein COLO4_03442 [Corchorus olitorius]|uniref:Uncharacterized protein n=1 Tax=Corchorus olitorius TaxID=93759 RepID=A0A1R3KYG8_9ROSI|nr:hypothetical protein COLO4_03442 [Corchorus olitorius]
MASTKFDEIGPSTDHHYIFPTLPTPMHLSTSFYQIFKRISVK